jgi:predicted nucleic acid-binding protein
MDDLMSKKIVLTCVCCLNILLDNMEFIEESNNEYILPQQVYDEFIRQNNSKLIKKMLYSKKHDIIQVYDMQIRTDEHKIYKSIVTGKLGPCFGKCESSAISIAIHNNGVLLTDDNDNIISNIGNYTLKWLNVNDLIIS